MHDTVLGNHLTMSRLVPVYLVPSDPSVNRHTVYVIVEAIMLRLQRLLPVKASFSSSSFSVTLSLLPRIRLIDRRTLNEQLQYSTQTDCRSSLVTDQQIETFRKDGVVHLKGVFKREWIEKIAKGIKENLKNPSAEWGKLIESETESGTYFVDFWNWQRIPEFKDFVFHSPAAHISSRLMDLRLVPGGGGGQGGLGC